MRRLASWMATLLLLVTSQLAVAQRGGHNAGGAGGMRGGSYPRDTDNDLKDIQKVVALQATEEQKSKFQSWRQETEAMKLRLQELRSAVATNDLSRQLDTLNAAMEKSNSGYSDFIGSLSEVQRAGLKKQIQQLSKSNNELAKTTSTAIRELGSANNGAKHPAKLGNVETAIENLLNAQKRIAAEMSISV
jgi:hypothetical protein